MQLRHMRIFLEVVRLGSMSGAAKSMYIAQPTVSQAIAEIEQEYNLRLFDRLNKKLYITPAGERLLDYASRINQLYTEMDSDLRSNRSRCLKLGATLTVGTCIFSELIAQYKAQWPEIETRVVVENTADIQAHLLTGELDLGLVEGRVTSADIVYEPVINDTLVLVAGPGHHFFRRDRVEAQELHGQPFILREEGSGTREFFERSMAEKGVQVDCVWVCQNTDAIKNAVMSGHGLTVISRRLVAREIEQGLLAACEIEGYDDRRTFALTYHKDKYMFPYFQGFMELCRSFEGG